MEFKRIFIEKKDEFDQEGKLLLDEFRTYLGIKSLRNVRIVNLYDLINVTEEEKEIIVEDILYESPIDLKYDEIPVGEDELLFRVKFLKGQFNQREDSLNELIRVLLKKDNIETVNTRIVVLDGINEAELSRIKKYYINPVEMREVDLEEFIYDEHLENREKVQILDGFIEASKEKLSTFKEEYGIAMDLEDIEFCQKYFIEEKRNPSIAEIKLIDTYWSDHCRHTTFMTEITDLKIDDGKYKELFESSIKDYLSSRDYVYGEETDRVISLMDLATINMKEQVKSGILDNKEKSKEVNAASIEIDVDVDGSNEKWLLMFKNETHNHPTEIEPFGGAGTCLGGAIRDPLSGRAYVYQAMRITGAKDPRQAFEDTIEGKLPQRKITKTALDGYSSYGYQIGASTGFVKEIYDDGYAAKRMEVGALVAAVKKESVFRGEAEPGDVVVLVGGKTGRDGLGGAVGSSKKHTEDSMEDSGAEVQKGNPQIERKIIRLFRREEISKMIKICNDFGAGGVSVAIGELADGLKIDLNKVPLKYEGLNGYEIALSESQERMAVVLDRKNVDEFLRAAKEEDVQATIVADVTEEKDLVMVWNNEEIVNIRREFLDTNGIRKKSKLEISQPKDIEYFKESVNNFKGDSIREKTLSIFSDLNIASQKGIVERFDTSVGRGTVLNPLGGEKLLTPIEGMVAKIPVLAGNTNTCSMMTYGYDPMISKWSEYHGGYYAVIESVGRNVALGGDYRRIRLSFQEYFERIDNDPRKWGKPFLSLLGAYKVQKELDIAAIGGKDSMSGTFEELHVPPTLISFAVNHDRVQNIISPEFKNTGSEIGLFEIEIDELGLINLDILKEVYIEIKENIDNGNIISASTVKYGGVVRSIGEMAMGNNIGAEISYDNLFNPLYGSIVVEVKEGLSGDEIFSKNYTKIGRTSRNESLLVNDEEITIEELIEINLKELEEVFPVVQGNRFKEMQEFKGSSDLVSKSKTNRPKVLIPVFMGTHGEYDLRKAFEKHGAEVSEFVFKALNIDDIENSFGDFARAIESANIIAFPNGTTLGGEPESGGKLIELILRNEKVKNAIHKHIEEDDGLVIGIGDGFKGLLKTGLIEYGEVRKLDKDSIYISRNLGNEFISLPVEIEVKSKISPWFNCMELGEKYISSIATKEGRICGNNIEKIVRNGQVSTVYAGFNPTGSSYNIESITSPNGRVLGMVSSVERMEEDLYKNIGDLRLEEIIKSGIEYFKEA